MDLILIVIVFFVLALIAVFFYKAIYQKQEGYARLVKRFGAWAYTVAQKVGFSVDDGKGGEIVPEPSVKSWLEKMLGGLGFIFWPFDTFTSIEKFPIQTGSLKNTLDSNGKREIEVNIIEIEGIDIPIGILNIYQEFEVVIGGYTCIVRALFPLRVINPQKCFFGVSKGNGLAESIKRAGSGAREYLGSCKDLNKVLEGASDLPYEVWTYLNKIPTLTKKEEKQADGQKTVQASQGSKEEKLMSAVEGCRKIFGVEIENFIQIVDIDTPKEFNETRQKTYETDVAVANRRKVADVGLYEDQQEAEGKRAIGSVQVDLNDALMKRFKDQWGEAGLAAYIAQVVGESSVAMQLFGLSGVGADNFFKILPSGTRDKLLRDLVLKEAETLKKGGKDAVKETKKQ